MPIEIGAEFATSRSRSSSPAADGSVVGTSRRFVPQFCLSLIILVTSVMIAACSSGASSAAQSSSALIDTASSAITSAHTARVVAALPNGVRDVINRTTDAAQAPNAWAQLPRTLDGRVRMQAGDASQAGWQMLDVGSVPRIDVPGAAIYDADDFTLVQKTDPARLREFIVVREHQGSRTWRWKLHARDASDHIRLLDNGRVDLGGGYQIDSPKLLDANGKPLRRPVRWTLRGDVLSLRFDDSALALPYIIDPDGIPPELSFVKWVPTGTNTWYDPTQDVDRVYYKPGGSGSMTAKLQANHSVAGSTVDHVSWPAAGSGWSPAAGNSSTSSSEAGLAATYYANGGTPPGSHSDNSFTGSAYSRIDSDINFTWGAGPPYVWIAPDRWSARWTGLLTAPETGVYHFQVTTDTNDGMQFSIDSGSGMTRTIDRWVGSGATTRTSCDPGISLTAGTKYPIRVEYYDLTGNATAILRWRKPSDFMQVPDNSAGACTNTATQLSATGLIGPGGSTYDPIPTSALSTTSSIYSRTYSWTGTPAAPGTISATATDQEGDTSAPTPFEIVPDTTPPAGGSLTIRAGFTGWHKSRSRPYLDFTLGNDGPGSGLAEWSIERREGQGDGTGACVGFGAWTDVSGPNPAVPTYDNAANAYTNQRCYEYRLKQVDHVGNVSYVNAAGFSGYDSTGPVTTFVKWTPSNEYSYWNGVNTTIYFNPNQAGDVTLDMTASDAAVGTITQVNFPNINPNGGWSPVSSVSVTSPPYTHTWSWTPGAANPDGESVNAADGLGNGGPTTAVYIKSDAAGPSGGGLMYTNGWENDTAAGVDIQVTAQKADGGSGLKEQRLLRRESTLTGKTCDTGAYSPWTEIGPTGLTTLPAVYTDTTVVDGMCYQYGIWGIDNVGNEASYYSTRTILVDDTDPTAVIDPAPADPWQGSVNVAFTITDLGSGPSTRTLRFTGPTNGSLYSSNTTAPSQTVTWNTSLLNGTYVLHLDVQDAAGNMVIDAATRTVVIDNSVPVITLASYTPLSGSQYHYWDGSSPTLYYNRVAGSGSFSMDMNVTSTGGVDHVHFTNNWPGTWNYSPPSGDVTGGNPYSMVYTWTSSSSQPAAESIYAYGAAQNQSGARRSAYTTVNVYDDSTKPSGMSITPVAGWTNKGTLATPFTVPFVKGTDTGSGVREWTIQRQEVAMTGTTCAAFPAMNAIADTIATSPAASPFADDTLQSGRCYKYGIVTTDNVGNPVVPASSVSANVVKVDRGAPTGTIDPASPASPTKGVVTIKGTSLDDFSGVVDVDVDYSGPSTGTVCANATPVASWTCSWDTKTVTPNGLYTLTATFTDAAGNTGTATRTLYIDNTAPTATLASIDQTTNPQYQHVTGSTVYVNGNQTGTFTVRVTASDADSGLDKVAFPALGTGWTPSGASNVPAPGPFDQAYAWTAAPNAPGAVTAQASDKATNAAETPPVNTADVPFTVVVDSAAPPATISTSDGFVAVPTITFDPGTDADSGTLTWQLQRDVGDLAGGVCSNWSGYTDYLAPDPASPQNDGTVANGHCYRYQIISTDNVGNTITQAAAEVAKIEQAGVIVTQSGGSTDIAEGGATDTYTIELATPPTSNVNITITGDANGTASPTALIFTPANWNLPQTVTVTAVQDDIHEGPHTATFTHAAASGDAAYSGIAIADVIANVTDDDVVGINVVETAPDTSVTEGGLAGADSDTFTVVLTSQPQTTVDITPVGDAQVTTTPATINFTAANWNVPQTVTVTAVDDPYDEADPHPGVVSFTVAGSDVEYAALTIPPVNVDVHDNDTSGITVVESGGSTDIGEDGTTDTFTVVLDTEPSANVTINVAGDAQATASPSPLTFTTANWNVPQTVTVSAVDDAVAEGPHTGIISMTVTSADTAYAALTPAPITANITDNDNVGVTITTTGLGVEIGEGGPTDTYTVVLTSQPTADVTITITPDAQQTVSPTSLTFTTGNWSTAQTVTVTAVDDLIVEAPVHAGMIAHSITSADAAYAAYSIPNLATAVTDNDAPDIVLTESAPDTSAVEGGTDTYEIHLGSQPTADVTISITGDAQGSATPATLTFTSLNYASDQTVTVTAIDDAIAEGPHTATFTHAVTSVDPVYNGWSLAPVVLNITDNDTAGVNIVESAGSTAATEGGADDSIDVSLSSEPLAPVDVTFTPDAQTTVAGGATPVTLTFTPGNWSVIQTIAIGAFDDAVVEGPHSGTVTATVASSDATYAALAPLSPILVAITDNDFAGLIVDPGPSVDVTEGGATDTIDVSLLSQPTADVTVTVGGDAQVSVAPTTLTFTSANWNSIQTVTVTAVDDAVAEGLHTGVVSISSASSDPNYQGLTNPPITVNVTDNDNAAITITESAGATHVAEDQSIVDDLSIVLTSEPTADVTIAINTDAQVAASPTSVTFTSSNWSNPQTIAVTAIDDKIAEANPHTGLIGFVVTSSDATYGAMAPADVTVSVDDDDTAGVVIDPTSDTTEGGPSDTYTVVLTSQPTGNVVITPSSDAQVTVTPAAVTFDSIDWETPKTFTITAVDDAVSEGVHHGFVTHAATSTDPSYNGITIATHDSTIQDNDSPSVIVTELQAPTTVAEAGGTSTYSLALNSQPTADVTIAITPDAQVSTDLTSVTFTTTNWASPQTITISAVDDAVAEGPHTGVISHVASSADTNYNGIGVATVTAAVIDNDTAGVTITESGGSTDVAEGAPSPQDTYTVVLESQPLADVTVTLTPDAQVTVNPTTLTFTAGNWSTAQTVSVDAVDDPIDETAVHPGIITHVAASMDTTYDAIAIADVTANVTDNDTSGVTITETGGSTDVSEATPSVADTYDVVLDSQPASDVTVTLTADAQVSVSPATLTFTTSNWSTAQTVSVTAVDDFIAEAPVHPGVIQHALSGDPVYAALTVADVTANVTDNDVAGFVLAPASPAPDVTEGGSDDTYTIALSSEPTSPVTIDLAGDTQVSVSPAQIVFDSTSWANPQTITVTAIDDLIDEGGDHAGTITHAVSSLDAAYSTQTIAPVVATVHDNDTAKVIIAPSPPDTHVNEDGTLTDTYDVSLATQPTADVTITITPDAQLTTSATTLTFTPTDYALPQTVTITAVDDLVFEGPHTGTITHAASSADLVYNGLSPIDSIIANIDDNDAPGINIDESGGTTEVTEGGATDTIDVKLASQPTSDVTLTLTGTQVTTSPATITFTPTDWMNVQTVTVTAIDDQIDESDPHSGTIEWAVSSLDAAYAALTVADTNVIVHDNDTAAIIITETSGDTTVSEDGTTLTDTYDVRLATEPTADVDVVITLTGQAAVTPSTLHFTPLDWSSNQTVTVTGVPDAVAEGPHTDTATHDAASADTIYDTLAPVDLTINVQDDDTAGLLVTESGGSTDITEGTPGVTDTVDVSLTSEPVADVTITVTGDAQVGATPATLTFTAGNWMTPQTLTVAAIDDMVDEGPHTGVLTITPTSADATYNAVVPATVTANITDNDTSAFVVTPTSGLTATEGGAGSSYDISLATMPSADVTITLTPDSQVDIAPTTLTFSAASWMTPQTITVTAHDDKVFEGPHTGTITHLVASGDAKYAALTIADQVVAITDDDVVGVVVTPSGADTTVEEGGATDTYDVRLLSEPTAPVTITPTPDAQVTVAPATLTFDSTNWFTDQTVTITAVDDAVFEGSHTGTITHVVGSLDTNYDAFSADPIVANIVDNDNPGITVTESGTDTTVAEDGSVVDDYEIVLDSQPTADVTITLNTGSQITAAPSTLTFTPGNWNQSQTVNLTAVNDAIAEGSHVFTLTHTVTSADLNYDGFTVDDVTVNIIDDDVAGLLFAETGGSTDVAEGGATDTYDISLTSEPTAPVTITLNGGAQLTASPTTLSFTPADWNNPQTVIVSAVDDFVAEGAHIGTIVHTGASSDPNYDSAGTFTAPDLTVDIADNDTAGFQVVETGGSTDVHEDGSDSDTYSIVLTSAPIDDVVITLTPDAQVAVSPTTLTFTPATWNVAQDVTVTGVQDDIDEPNIHPGIIAHSVSSTGDALYNSLTIADITVNVTDDDTAGVVVLPTGLDTHVSEAGLTDTYTVVLATQPTADVTITPSPALPPQVTVSPATLTFTTANWNVPQTITVTAIQDQVQEASPHASSVDHAAASADPNYDAALVIAPMSVSIDDDDTAAVVITESGGSTDLVEGGATDTYDVRLATEPTADVTVTLTPDSQVAGTPVTLTFTPVNWSADQTVTINAVDDLIAEGSHTGVMSHTVTSADTFYTAVTAPTVTANIVDNDTPDIIVTISGTDTSVTEGGAGDDYTIRLDSIPTADVTISFDGGTQLVAPPALTFTPGNWNIDQTVPVAAIDDWVKEPSPHTGMMSHIVTSADSMYNGFTVAPVSVDITDNDVASVTASVTSVSVAEAGTTSATYDLVLTSIPSAPVTIAIATPDGQTTAAPAAVTFTPGNWNVPQSVTVTAVDDQVDEDDPHPGAVTHVVTSGDTDYDGFSLADIAVDIADDDTAGIDVAMSGSDTTVGESGTPASDTVDVTLHTKPIDTVTVTLTADAQVTVSPTTLTFDASNWNMPQTVTVAAVDDHLIEASVHPGTIALTVASTSDAKYDGLVAPDITADVLDDDVAGLEIVESGGSTDVTEGGAGDDYTVALTAQPTADVTVTITPGPDTSVTPTTLLFTPATWNVAQTVNVAAVDDALIEGAEVDTISHAVSSTDTNFGALTGPFDVLVNVTDNDVANLLPTDTDGDTTVEEGGATDTVSIELTAEPTAPVTVTVAGDADISVSPTTLTFTPADWNVAQDVTVTAIDDPLVEGPEVATMTATSSSTDTNFDNLTMPPVNVNVVDNDLAELLITETLPDTTVTENGPDDTFDVQLKAQPLQDVVVTMTTGPDITVTPTTLTFTSANWNVAQTVTVAAAPDDVMEGPETDAVSFMTASLDTNFDAIVTADLVVHVNDDDVAGVTITESGGSTDIDEDGTTDTYDVVLTSEPTDDVTITLTPDAQVTTSPTSLTFSAATWNDPQTVTVSAVNDDVVEPTPHTGVITHAASSTDANYDDAAVTIADVTASIGDNDVAGIDVDLVDGSLDVTEAAGAGDTDSYKVRLTSQPIDDVTITVVGDAQAAPTAATATLTFTAANWNQYQTVDVKAIDDLVAEPPHTGTLTYTASSLDAVYDNLPIARTETVNITDNDVADVVVDETDGDTTVHEDLSDNDTINLSLATQPTADVTVTIAGDAQVDVTPTTLTFTAANFATPQTVTITAHPDFVIEGPHQGTVTFTVASTGDPMYDAFAVAPVTVDIIDDDVAGVTVVESDGSTDVDEGDLAATDSYDLALTAQPTADVVVALSTDAQVAATPSTVTFTSANWNVPQTVTVAAVDDFVDEGPHVGVISHTTSSTDTNFLALSVADVNVNVADNDTASITLAETGADTSVDEDGETSDTYSLVLTSQPTADVVVAVSSVDANLKAIVPATYTFTPATWNVPQTITVTAHDDFVVEGPHTGTVKHVVTSLDPKYGAQTVPDLTVAIADNDTAQINVDVADGVSVAEAGPTSDTFVVTLSSIPTAPVKITFAQSPTGQVTISPATLTFDASNWNDVAHGTVTVKAVNDDVDEDPHPVVALTGSVTTTDPNFATATIDPVDVSVDDDDEAGLVVSAPKVSVTEGGASATYSVQLASKPTADVIVTPTGDAQAIASPATVTISPSTWNKPHPITVDAIDDAVVEPSPHTGLILNSVSSTDPLYNDAPGKVPPVTVTVDITDNDVAAVIVEETGGSTKVTEGGATDKVSYRLGSQPTADVKITLTPVNPQVTLNASTITFTSANWNTAVDVVVTAVDDAIVEGDHSVKVDGSVASTDPNYQGPARTVASFTAAITDNDAAGLKITETDGGTEVTEGAKGDAAGASDTYTIALTNEPTKDVTINLDGGTQVAVSPKTITFTPANFSVEQTITVTAIDDRIDEDDPHAGSVSHTIVTSAPGYDTLQAPSVDVKVHDDDVLGVIVTTHKGGAKVAEGGKTDTVSIKLRSQPLRNVVIKVSGDRQIDVAPDVLEFTPANFSKYQKVTVTAIDDADVEGRHTGLMSMSIESDDAGYAATAVKDVSAMIIDNDKDVIPPADDGGVGGNDVTKPKGPVKAPPKSGAKGGSERTDLGKGRTDLGKGVAPKPQIRKQTKPKQEQLGDDAKTASKQKPKADAGPSQLAKLFANAADFAKQYWLYLVLIAGAALFLGTMGWVAFRGDPVTSGRRTGSDSRFRPEGAKREKGDDEDDAPSSSPSKSPGRRRPPPRGR